MAPDCEMLSGIAGSPGVCMCVCVLFTALAKWGELAPGPRAPGARARGGLRPGAGRAAPAHVASRTPGTGKGNSPAITNRALGAGERNRLVINISGRHQDTAQAQHAACFRSGLSGPAPTCCRQCKSPQLGHAVSSWTAWKRHPHVAQLTGSCEPLCVAFCMAFCSLWLGAEVAMPPCWWGWGAGIWCTISPWACPVIWMCSMPPMGCSCITNLRLSALSELRSRCAAAWLSLSWRNRAALSKNSGVRPLW